MFDCGFLDAVDTWTVLDILQFTAAEEDRAVSEQCHDFPLHLVIGDFIIPFLLHFWMNFFYD